MRADDLKALDNYMHALGHSLAAADTARVAQSELADSRDGLATLALAVAQLSDAVTGMLDARAQHLAARLGIDLDALGEEGVS